MAKSEHLEHVLHRYTNFPALLYLLRRRKITLLSPDLWEDRNDAYFLNVYRDRKEVTSLLALCLTQSPETFHHWKVFTRGSDGVCIEFDRARLLSAFDGIPGIEYRSVRYKRINECRAGHLAVADLPFLKRYPYRNDAEFRILWSSRTEERQSKDFDIPLSCVRRVTISPWMPEGLVPAVKETIKAVNGCGRLPVYQSTLLENATWRKYGRAAIIL